MPCPDGWWSQQGVVDGNKRVQLGGHCRDTEMVGGSWTPSPSCSSDLRGQSPHRGSSLGHPIVSPPAPAPVPRVPSPTFHVLQGSLQPVDTPAELGAELEAEQSISKDKSGGPQAAPRACRGGGGQAQHPPPTAQCPSTHLLVQLLPQGSLHQRCQQVVEPAVGQSRVLMSP